MKPLFLSFALIITAIFAYPARAVIVDISEYEGRFDTADMTPFVSSLLRDCSRNDTIKILFPKGLYHFHPQHAYGKYHCITNHDNGYRSFAFPLIGFHNIEIDGGGSEFIFHGKIIPFLIENSHGVTLRNITVDWQIPFTLEGKVVGVDEKNSSIEVDIPEGFGYGYENGKLIMRGEGWEERLLGENIVFDPQTMAVAYRTDDYYIPKPHNFDIPVREIYPGRYEMKTKFARAIPPVGTVMTFKGLFTQNRHSPAIHSSASSDILIEDVTIHHCGGMGFVAERSENITLRRFNVVLREGSGRMITTTADATHFCNCKGVVLVEECVFENMLDDATNVHGTYVRVVEIVSEDQLIVKINHPQQFGFVFAGAGDIVDVVDGETLLTKHTLTIKEVENINEQYIRLTLEAAHEGRLIVGDGLENMTWYPQLVFRGNIVRNNRARSILISTPRRVLVENNIFSSMMAAILCEGDMDHWYESGAVKDVTIRGNKFLDGTYGGAGFPTIFINPHQKRVVEGQPYEKNIIIEDNLFRTFNEQLLRVNSAENLLFRNNTIEQSTTYRPYNNLPTVDIRNSVGVVIENNKYNKPGEITIIRR